MLKNLFLKWRMRPFFSDFGFFRGHVREIEVEDPARTQLYVPTVALKIEVVDAETDVSENFLIEP